MTVLKGSLSVSTLWAMVAAFSAGASSEFIGFGLAAVVVPLLLVVYEPKAVVALVAMLLASRRHHIQSRTAGSNSDVCRLGMGVFS
jgi:uncharacterized membrane protein YfcA